MGTLASGYEAVMEKHAAAEGASGGGGDAKAQAETALENAAFLTARALVNHFTKTGNLDSLGKVDYTKTEIVRLRNQDLVDQSTAIRDLAAAAVSQAGAAGRGITAELVAGLTAAIAAFKKVMSIPRSQTVNRSTLKKEVATDVAALVVLATSMDDLTPQFSGTEAGRRFIEAWKSARMIIDTGGGHTPPPTPPPTPKP